MQTIRLCAVLVLAAIQVGCDSSGRCEPGTVQVNGTCFAHDPSDDVPPVVTVDPPARTREVNNVRLTTNEHATIYYTTDGTTPSRLSLNETDVVLLPDVAPDTLLSFFAVDVNGNASAVQTVTWQIDRNGPAAPMPFALDLEGSMRTLTWTPPADPNLAGVLVVRVEGLQTAAPEHGRRYVPGDAIGAGMTVVAAVAPGFAGTFSEMRSSPPGIVRYLAWSYDDLANYGPPVGAYALTTIEAQTATLTVDSATGVVTVGAQPANMMLAGTASLDGSDLTVKLDVTNATSRVLFAPKLLVTNALVTPHSFDNSDGTFDSFPYRALGGAIAPGATAAVTLAFGSVTSGDALSLSLAVRDGRVIVGGHWSDSAGSVVDEATDEVVVSLASGASGPGGDASMHGGAVTPDGRVIMGSRSSAEIVSYDVSTGGRLMSTLLAAGKWNVPRLMLDPSGAGGYALLGAGHAWTARYEGVPTQLVTFDAGTLRETGRIDIGSSRNRDIAISADGRWAAVATGVIATGVVIVDLTTLRVARTVTSVFRVTGVEFTADSTSLLAASSENLELYRVADGSLMQSIALPPGGGKSFHGVFGPDGRFWLGRKSDLLAIDLTTEATEVFDFDAAIIHTANNKLYVAAEGQSDVSRIDTAGVEETTLSFDDSVYGHWVGHSPF